MPDALVQLNDVRCTRGSFELHIPEWTVRPGEVVGLVGPNGVGKTTLLRLLAGIDPADSGQISVLGMDPISNFVDVRSGRRDRNDFVRASEGAGGDGLDLLIARIGVPLHLQDETHGTVSRSACWFASHCTLLLTL